MLTLKFGISLRKKLYDDQLEPKSGSLSKNLIIAEKHIFIQNILGIKLLKANELILNDKSVSENRRLILRLLVIFVAFQWVLLCSK